MIQNAEEPDLFAEGLQLLRHFEGNQSSETESAERIRAGRLAMAQPLNVVVGGFLNCLELRGTEQGRGLQTVNWLVLRKIRDHMEVTTEIITHFSGNKEERRTLLKCRPIIHW